MTNLLNQFSTTLITIAIALVSLAGSYALYFIGKAKTKLSEETIKNVKDATQRTLIQNALDRVSTLAQTVVTETEQTTAASLRQAVANGTVDKSELIALGKNAVGTIYSQLKPDTISLLETELTDVKGYITSVVEAQVFNLKQNSPTALNIASTPTVTASNNATATTGQAAAQ